MSDEDVQWRTFDISGQATSRRSARWGTVIRSGTRDKRFMAASYRFAIFREPCIYRSLENRCTSVAGTINEIKYLISYRNTEDQISDIHQLESILSKINRFSLYLSLRKVIKHSLYVYVYELNELQIKTQFQEYK